MTASASHPEPGRISRPRASCGISGESCSRSLDPGIMVRVVACLTLFLAACAGGGAGRESNPWEDLGPGKESGPVFLLGGTVRHVELEGGLFVIDAADGTRYVPTNLPPDYQVDGLALEAEARRRDDMASIAMVAPLVELVRIRKAAAAMTMKCG